jgi:hypothetical protein
MTLKRELPAELAAQLTAAAEANEASLEMIGNILANIPGIMNVDDLLAQLPADFTINDVLSLLPNDIDLGAVLSALPDNFDIQAIIDNLPADIDVQSVLNSLPVDLAAQITTAAGGQMPSREDIESFLANIPILSMLMISWLSCLQTSTSMMSCQVFLKKLMLLTLSWA